MREFVGCTGVSIGEEGFVPISCLFVAPQSVVMRDFILILSCVNESLFFSQTALS